jgi:hypothetical protein
VKKKPAVQNVESKGRPDELIAHETWRRFLLRNDRFVVVLLEARAAIAVIY